jgi:hypothetical protein
VVLGFELRTLSSRALPLEPHAHAFLLFNYFFRQGLAFLLRVGFRPLSPYSLLLITWDDRRTQLFVEMRSS